jgi:hypothetical protein
MSDMHYKDVGLVNRYVGEHSEVAGLAPAPVLHIRKYPHPKKLKEIKNRTGKRYFQRLLTAVARRPSPRIKKELLALERG